MTLNSPATHELVLGERPTRAAQLKITAEPARVKFTARRWLIAEGTLPPGEARQLIAAFGILGSVVASIAGAVLTLRISPELTTLALAELVLACAGAVLIAVCGRARRGGRETGRPEIPRGLGVKPGKAPQLAESAEPAGIWVQTATGPRCQPGTFRRLSRRMGIRRHAERDPYPGEALNPANATKRQQLVVFSPTLSITDGPPYPEGQFVRVSCYRKRTS